MRCYVSGEVIPVGDEYYKINGENVCIDHIEKYLDDWCAVDGGYEIEGHVVDEDELASELNLRLEVCEEEEEPYNPFDEPEYWKERNEK